MGTTGGAASVGREARRGSLSITSAEGAPLRCSSMWTSGISAVGAEEDEEDEEDEEGAVVDEEDAEDDEVDGCVSSKRTRLRVVRSVGEGGRVLGPGRLPGGGGEGGVTGGASPCSSSTATMAGFKRAMLKLSVPLPGRATRYDSLSRETTLNGPI